jgi:hypothetical protein
MVIATPGFYCQVIMSRSALNRVKRVASRDKPHTGIKPVNLHSHDFPFLAAPRNIRIINYRYSPRNFSNLIEFLSSGRTYWGTNSPICTRAGYNIYLLMFPFFFQCFQFRQHSFSRIQTSRSSLASVHLHSLIPKKKKPLNKMKLTILLSTLVALAMATPTPQKANKDYNGTGACKFSSFEKSNLGHHHDVNTGKIKSGNNIKTGAPTLNGAGCSPAWAVGGELNDNTPTVTPKDQRKGRGKGN